MDLEEKIVETSGSGKSFDKNGILYTALFIITTGTIFGLVYKLVPKMLEYVTPYLDFSKYVGF